MPGISIRKPWDVDHGETPTPESVYQSRRQFIRATGLMSLGAVAGVTTPSVAVEFQPDTPTSVAARLRQLKDSLRPIAHSAFRAGVRNNLYQVQRAATDELVAARYNNFYEFGLDKDACWQEAQKLSVRPWTIEIGGLVAKPITIAIDDLIRKMPCEERLYRFRCVERWAMVVPWSGFPFSALMKWVKPLSAAKYVRFVSFHRPAQAMGQRPPTPWSWPYYEGLRLDEAANELTFMATGLYGHDIPRQHGAPLRMVLPWKYGYKGAKSIVKIEFTDKQPHTFWNDYAPMEYGFYSNVNPNKPHPRWSQAQETMIGTNKSFNTKTYNGYGQYVAGLYTGRED